MLEKENNPYTLVCFFAFPLLLFSLGAYFQQYCEIKNNIFALCSPSRKTSQAQNGASLCGADSPQASSSSEVAVETEVKCRVCGIPADARFEPCGHVIACMECAAMLKKCFLCKVECSQLFHYCYLLLSLFLSVCEATSKVSNWRVWALASGAMILGIVYVDAQNQNGRWLGVLQ